MPTGDPVAPWDSTDPKDAPVFYMFGQPWYLVQLGQFGR